MDPRRQAGLGLPTQLEGSLPSLGTSGAKNHNKPIWQQTSFSLEPCAAQRPGQPTCSITSMTEGAAMVTGASSMIFWCLRWIEQSRPKREMALPYSSASTCTSRCRACCASCIRKMGDPGASACTCVEGEGRAPASSPKIHPRMEASPAVSAGGNNETAGVGAGPHRVPQDGTRMGMGMGVLAPLTCRKQVPNSSAASTFRMPLPPPPSAALIITG